MTVPIIMLVNLKTREIKIKPKLLNMSHFKKIQLHTQMKLLMGGKWIRKYLLQRNQENIIGKKSLIVFR